VRIGVVASLLTGEKNFRELKEITGATDGNLSVTLSKLEEMGYIKITKDFFNNKPRTRCSLTAQGKDAFVDYVNMLDNIIKQYDSENK
jgi:DNA-binding HxlR family transcriptional regulator